MSAIAKISRVETLLGSKLCLDLPEGCDVLVVCTNDGTGLRPVRIVDAANLYQEDIDNLARRLGRHGSIVAIPACREHYRFLYDRTTCASRSA